MELVDTSVEINGSMKVTFPITKSPVQREK